jgi:hypothetical protein
MASVLLWMRQNMAVIVVAAAVVSFAAQIHYLLFLPIHYFYAYTKLNFLKPHLP